MNTLELKYSQTLVNPHTTKKNNSHFRLYWGPLDPAISFTLKTHTDFLVCVFNTELGKATRTLADNLF